MCLVVSYSYNRRHRYPFSQGLLDWHWALYCPVTGSVQHGSISYRAKAYQNKEEGEREGGGRPGVEGEGAYLGTISVSQ